MQNPVNLIDPTGMFSDPPGDGTDPPGEAGEIFSPNIPNCNHYTRRSSSGSGGADAPLTNSEQVNAVISRIGKQHPDSAIYLLVQSNTSEGHDRQLANTPNQLSYDLYQIQEGKDLTKGSIAITVKHGKGNITGGIIETMYTKEVEASFSLFFKGAGNIGGSDELVERSMSQIPIISSILNGSNQSVVISSHSILGTNEIIDPSKVKGRGLINGVVRYVTSEEFGQNRNTTVINALISAGAIKSLLIRGGVSIYTRNDSDAKNGTFIDFKFTVPILRDATRMNYSGTINLNKGKLQIY